MIINVRWFAVGVVALSLLTACTHSGSTLFTSRTPSPTAESARKALENWHIDLTLSGGIAGLRRAVELSSTGQLSVTDQKRAKQITAQVPEEELAEIAALLAKAQPFQPASRPQTCPDCFQYELGVRMNGQQFSVQVNDLALAESGLESLISALVSLQERALAGQLNP